jgi:hypothetical protein
VAWCDARGAGERTWQRASVLHVAQGTGKVSTEVCGNDSHEKSRQTCARAGTKTETNGLYASLERYLDKHADVLKVPDVRNLPLSLCR